MKDRHPLFPRMLAPGGEEEDEGLGRRLLRNRIVVLGTSVEDDVANRICAELLLLAGESDQDIMFYINSPGGNVSAGMAIYDIMQYIPNDVATVAMGMAASMGQFLLCSGAPGKRAALPHARIMMHQPLGGVSGTASEIAIQAAHMNWVKSTMAERIAYHTGQPLAKIAADGDRDRWFTAQEAVDYGMIDKIVGTTPGMPPPALAARAGSAVAP